MYATEGGLILQRGPDLTKSEIQFSKGLVTTLVDSKGNKRDNVSDKVFLEDARMGLLSVTHAGYVWVGITYPSSGYGAVYSCAKTPNP
jgi:hypothetical protein